jgi:DNA-binding HxlR family transcriptional regulator
VLQEIVALVNGRDRRPAPQVRHRRGVRGPPPDGSAQRVLDMLDQLRGRWKLPILFRLYGAGRLRFSDLQRALCGVSHKMLTQHLRELEADGWIIRTERPGPILHVEYSPTRDALALRGALASLRELANTRGLAESQHA